MARAAEASTEQIKVMIAGEQSSEANQSVNVLRYDASQGIRKDQTGCRLEKTKSEKCGFCGMVHASRSCPAFGKTCNYRKKTGHFEPVCQAKQRQRYSRPKGVDVLGESEDGEVSDDDLLTYSVESNNEGCSKNDWHVVLKFGKRDLNFKLDIGADCNVMSQSSFEQLSLTNTRIFKNKNKLKMFDDLKITPKGKVSLGCEYKVKFTVLDFVLLEQDLPSILGLKSCLEIELVKRVYGLEVDPPKIETEFSDAFEGLGEMKDVQYQIKIDPLSNPAVHPPRRVLMALRKPLEEELRRMEKLRVIEKKNEPTPLGYIVWSTAEKQITKFKSVWIPVI